MRELVNPHIDRTECELFHSYLQQRQEESPSMHVRSIPAYPVQGSGAYLSSQLSQLRFGHITSLSQVQHF